jgi:alpha-tubulin suppressor-like RCC1 family protein
MRSSRLSSALVLCRCDRHGERVLRALSIALLAGCAGAVHEAAPAEQPGAVSATEIAPAPAAEEEPAPPEPEAPRVVPRTIAFGAQHRCKLEDGRVLCTGDDQHGQLGRGRIDVLDTSSSPVVGIDDAVSICAGALTSCAVRRSGELWCWGWNIRGQLGPQRAEDGSALYRSPTPLRAPDAGDSVACTIGPEHACAIRASGTVRCWGPPSFGQLGADTTANVAEVEGLGDVVELTSGEHHVCARTSDGAVYCWGQNRYRAVAPAEEAVVRVPRRVEGIPRALAIEAGGDVSCALTEQAVWCWGRNDHGQLGRGEMGEPDGTPRRVIALLDVTEIGVGRDRACAVQRDGRVLCWGSRLYGAREEVSATPLDIPRLRGATRLDWIDGPLCALVGDATRCAPPPPRSSEGLL